MRRRRRKRRKRRRRKRGEGEEEKKKEEEEEEKKKKEEEEEKEKKKKKKKKINGATGIVAKGLEEGLETMAGKQSIDSLKTKKAILGTSQITRELLQSATRSLSVGDRCCFNRRSTPRLGV